MATTTYSSTYLPSNDPDSTTLPKVTESSLMLPKGGKGRKRQGFAWSRSQQYQFSGPVVSISCSIAVVIRYQIAALT